LQDAHIADDPRYDLAGGGLNEEIQGKALNVLIESISDIKDYLLPDPGKQILLTVAGDPLHEIEEEDGQGQKLQHSHVVMGEDIIHHILQEQGRDPGGGGNHDHADASKEKLRAIGDYKLKETTVDSHDGPE
jgi:hypothetical protein